MAKVEHVEQPDGSHAIGVTLEGVFVPFVSKDAAVVADRVEAGKSPEAHEAAGTTPTEESA